MQSSLAVKGVVGPWFLLNASPDLRQQLAALPSEPVSGLRSTPVGGVLLTDAEIDHSAGLLLLRESSVPLRLYSTEEVRHALTDHYPVLRMLESYCGLEWSPLELGARRVLEGSSLEIEAFATGGDAPLYMPAGALGPTSVGLSIRDLESGGSVTYAPSLASFDERTAERFAASDRLLLDGTFWTADELISLGISTRDGADMGHLPLSGPDGSLVALSTLSSRTIFVHVNNTNPILLAHSPERAVVEASGAQVAYDGMELEL